MGLVFFGNEQLAQGLKHYITSAFDALVKNGYEISTIVLPMAKEVKSRNKHELEIMRKAEELGIPVLTPNKPKEILEELAAMKPEIGVLSSYGKMVPKSIIDLFPLGILNIHPSLLPKYRGTTPIETAILKGDKQTGVSVMGLVPEMDAGPIFAQGVVKTTTDDTKQSLYEKLATTGAELLIEVLPRVLDGTAEPREQDESQATFTVKLNRSMSDLLPTIYSADELARQVVAFAGFPKSKLTLLGLGCTITAAHAATAPRTELDPLCADGKYLVIDSLVPPNSKPMSASAFLNGYKNGLKK